jgi:hypothetical protein
MVPIVMTVVKIPRAILPILTDLITSILKVIAVDIA